MVSGTEMLSILFAAFSKERCRQQKRMPELLSHVFGKRAILIGLFALEWSVNEVAVS